MTIMMIYGLFFFSVHFHGPFVIPFGILRVSFMICMMGCDIPQML